MLPEDQNSPQPTKKELTQVGAGGIKSLRTFQGDVAEALGKNNTTIAQMAIAENARKADGEVKSVQAAQKMQEAPAPVPPAPIVSPLDISPTVTIAPVIPKTPPMTVRAPEVITNGPEPVQSAGATKKVLLFFFSLILLSGGIFGGLYFYSKSPLASVKTPGIPQKGVYRGLLSSNIQKKIVLGSLTDKRLEEILAYEKSQAKLDTNQVSELYFTKGEPSEPVLISAEEFINLSTTRSPETVRRSLLPRFMFGFHKTQTVVEPYLVLKTEFFQNTFTGMLKWEPDILADTKTWFSDKGVLGTQSFEDKIVKNKDVRILRDASGEVAILYGFLDKETLLITTNEATFLEILDRFEKQTYVR